MEKIRCAELLAKEAGAGLDNNPASQLLQSPRKRERDCFILRPPALWKKGVFRPNSQSAQQQKSWGMLVLTTHNSATSGYSLPSTKSKSESTRAMNCTEY